MDESVIKHLELTGESLKYHLLAEAIRKGCAIRPRQCIQSFYGGEFASCALGAAGDGLGWSAHDIDDFPRVTGLPMSLAYCIVDRNDYGQWTREAIANRLDDVAYGRLKTF